MNLKNCISHLMALVAQDLLTDFLQSLYNPKGNFNYRELGNVQGNVFQIYFQCMSLR